MFDPSIVDNVIKKFPDAQKFVVPEKQVYDPESIVIVPAEKIREVCQYLKSDSGLSFDLPIHMTAVDYIKENQFELVYYLYSTKLKKAIVVKARIDRAKAEIDSVTPVWSGMNFQESEVYDLMGIIFKGHPKLTRIMMWEGFSGFPLRKDYVHTTDRFDSGLEVGTSGLDAKGIPIVEAK